MQLTSKKASAALMATLILVGAWRLGYPAVLEQVHGEIPSDWRLDYRRMTVGQINSALGEPSEVASAKEYQSWVRKHWWGVEELKIIAPGCCAPESRPSEAYYVVHAKGFYDPVATKRIQ
ncbi:hypothetical protein [Dyella sp. 2RAB6]|uniref:hypothetical protein n=1 Tax=Dyella sp. 2RAB6 TaxID=3232992 RepID=UPI003F9165A2